jgi:CO dehydrogenase/acetyl-CoA synthase beta subunit
MMINAFDSLFARVREIAGTRFVDLAVPIDAFDFPVAAQVSNNLILKADTAVELGGATNGSCTFILATNKLEAVRDGKVRLFGPDIPDLAKRGVVPFAQIILAAGCALDSEDYQLLEECQLKKDFIRGYLVRGKRGEIWSRVSNRLFDEGFDFARLGFALAGLVKTTVANVESVEVLFVTASKENVREFEAARNQWSAIAHDLRKELWLKKGIDIDCPYGGGHCGTCDMKDVCDGVRKIKRMYDEEGNTDV